NGERFCPPPAGRGSDSPGGEATGSGPLRRPGARVRYRHRSKGTDGNRRRGAARVPPGGRHRPLWRTGKAGGKDLPHRSPGLRRRRRRRRGPRRTGESVVACRRTGGPEIKEINVGLLGAGVVGAGTLDLLERQGERIARSIGATFVVRKVLVRDLARPRDVPIDPGVLTGVASAILDDPAIDV